MYVSRRTKLKGNSSPVLLLLYTLIKSKEQVDEKQNGRLGHLVLLICP